MNTYIVLLRGVNVGGKNILPMKALKAMLETQGYTAVKTYIQSGNVVLEAGRNPQEELGLLIQREFGFSPDVMVLEKHSFESAVANNPYPDFEGKTVHFYFCKTTPALNVERLQKLSSDSEMYEVVGDVFYLHAPDGIGRSKLVAGVESGLGVSATGRNLNTVNKLREMIA